MRIAPQRKGIERPVTNAWHRPAPWLFYTLANTHFHDIFGQSISLPWRGKWKSHLMARSFSIKMAFLPKYKFPKGMEQSCLDFLFGRKLFCWIWDKKRNMGLACLAKWNRDWLLPQNTSGKQDSVRKKTRQTAELSGINRLALHIICKLTDV